MGPGRAVGRERLMRTVVYVAPFPMDATLRFARGLAGLADVRLCGVLQQAPAPDASPFDDVTLVDDALDAGDIAAACDKIQRHFGPIHRLTGILEPLQVPLAEARTALGIAGPDPGTATKFRDKALMKDEFRAAGIPCARHRLCTCADDGMAFAAEVGLPIVLKPPAGAGCRGTWRIDDQRTLAEALRDIAPSPHRPVLAEEFLRGQEGSLEMVVIGGRPVARSLSRYLPGPLEVLRNPWMQWVCWLPRDLGHPSTQAIIDLGAQVVDVLGLRDGIAHLEWFRRDDGSLSVGEVAARPPGGQLSLMTGIVHGADIYRTWARAVVDGCFDGPWQRQFSAGTAFLRGLGAGRVARVDGLDEAWRRIGDLVVEARLPRVGALKGDSYEGDGYIVVKHEDEGVVQAALRAAIETIRVRYA